MAQPTPALPSSSTRDGNAAITAPPRGRPPADLAGNPMVWDQVAAVWRSSHFPHQTRAPKVKTPRSSNRKSIISNLYRQQPSGPVPADSHGAPMVWDSAMGLWKSTSDENETRTARVRPDIAKSLPASRQHPGGRPPLDSHRTPMRWNSEIALWQSIHDEDETRTARVRSANTNTNAKAFPQFPKIAPMQVVTSAQVAALDDIDAAISSVTGKPDANGSQSQIAPANGSSFQTPRKRASPDDDATVNNNNGNPALTPVPRGRVPLDSLNMPMSWDSSAALWRSTRIPAETKLSKKSTPSGTYRKPGGRTPHDSNGKTMLWDGECGLWRSPDNPEEVKATNTKTPRLSASGSRSSSRGKAPGNTNINTKSPTSQTPIDSAGHPMTFDQETALWKSEHVEGETKKIASKPGGRPPQDSKGERMEWWSEQCCWRSKSNPQETRKPNMSRAGNNNNSNDNGNGKKSSDDGGGPAGSNNSKALIGPKTEEESIGLTMRPGGRTPIDSKGDNFLWDGVNAIWRSANDPNETKKPGVRKWAVNGKYSENQNELVDQDVNEDDPRDADFVSNGGARLNADGGTETSDGDDVGANSGSLIPKPGGRRPHDSTGTEMEWCEVRGLWRSTKNPEETRAVNKNKKEKKKKLRTFLSMLDPPSGSTRGGGGTQEEEEEEVSDETDESESDDAGKDGGGTNDMDMEESGSYSDSSESVDENGAPPNSTSGAAAVMRPVGRAPNDSNGQRMEWSNDRNCWVSKTNEAETKSRNPKPPRRMGKTLMLVSGLQSGNAPSSSNNNSNISGDGGKLLQQNNNKNLNRRPSGRAPNDSKGKGMLWDAQVGCWRSPDDPEEVKYPNNNNNKAEEEGENGKEGAEIIIDDVEKEERKGGFEEEENNNSNKKNKNGMILIPHNNNMKAEKNSSSMKSEEEKRETRAPPGKMDTF